MTLCDPPEKCQGHFDSCEHVTDYIACDTCIAQRRNDGPRFCFETQATARTVACSWCGRSIYEADGRWLATKGKERGYDPLLCDANDDGAHEPAVEGSSTADGGDEGV